MLIFNVVLHCFVSQAYDDITRSRWMRLAGMSSKTFSLSDSVRKIDWDTFLRVIGECPSAAGSSSSTASLVGAASTSPAAGAYETRAPFQQQCWICFGFGHTKTNCPSIQSTYQPLKPKGGGKAPANPYVAPSATPFPAIANGGYGDGKAEKGAGKNLKGKNPKGKGKDKLATNIAAVFAKR
jgi:hypothetical protein